MCNAFSPYQLLIFCLLFFAQTSATNFCGDIFEEGSIESNCFSTTEGLISSIVGGHVAVISGDYVDNSMDCTLVGPEPLTWQRSYSSNPAISMHGIEMGTLFPDYAILLGPKHCAWQFNHWTNFYVHVDFSKTTRKHGRLSAFIPHAFYSQMLHQCKLTDKKYHNQDNVLPLVYQKGVTNCASGAISAQTNPKNVKANFLRNFKTCEITLGSRDVRYYRGFLAELAVGGNLCLWKFFPYAEKKANGNQFLYHGFHISALNASGTTEFSWLDLKKISNREIQIHSSHFDPIIYRYSHLEVKHPLPGDCRNGYYLDSVSRPDQPEESYAYTQNVRKDGWLLSRKNRPDQRFLEIEYYRMGDIPGEYWNSRIVDDLDPSANRVKCLKAPVGYDAQPIVTHRFFYNFSCDIDRKKNRVATYAGFTTVYDAYDRKSIYHFNDNHRLERLIQFVGTTPYLMTRYFWEDTVVSDSSGEDSPNQGNLMSKVLYKGKNQICSGRFFDYDEDGNILKERLFGDLTGTCQIPVELDKNHQPIKNGAEYYERHFSYADNLLMEECEPNGRKTQYGYKGQTNLISHKFFLEQDKICAREFYKYDENSVCKTYISDNGSGIKAKDLTDVTERHISHYFSTQTIPIGLPERIDEMFVDLASGEEKLIKRTLQTFSKAGLLLRREVFDAEGISRYTLEWDYDAHGNIIREVNALGQVITKKYDANDNLIYEAGPSPDFYKEHTYDFSNRRTSTREIHSTGEIFVTQDQYDFVGNRIAHINRYGNTTHYQYDDLNRLCLTIHPLVNTLEGPIQPIVKIKPDEMGNPQEETDARGFTTVKSHNIRGQVTSILHPDGQFEQFEYDLGGTLAKKIDSNGTYTLFEVDCFKRPLSEKIFSATGELLQATSSQYDRLHKISSIDATGLETLFTYDGAGRLVQTACQDKIILFEYDALGRLIKRKEPYGDQLKVSCTEYDLLDRVIQERIEDKEGQILKQLSYVYDYFGNRSHIIEETAAGISQTISIYNSANQLITKISPDGSETHISYTPYTNELGQNVLKTISTDPLGRQTIIINDALERPISVERKDAFGILLSHQEMLYDTQSNLIRLIDHVIVDQTSRPIETRFEYQERGQMTCLIQAKDKPEQQITHIKYNRFGEKACVTKANGVILRYKYDALGRLASYFCTDQSLHYSYTYRMDNQIERVDDLVQKTISQFDYDSYGRISAETLSNGLTVHYQYDLLNRVTALTLPDKSSIAYHYNEANLKHIERFKNQQLQYAHHYDQFDLAGLNLKSTAINDQPIYYQYDKQKRPVQIQNKNYKLTEAKYDAVGHLIDYYSEDPIGKLQNRFTYNDLEQLTSEQSHVTQHYTCDSLHNRLSKNQVPSSFNDLHQLLSNGETSFSYDLSGNLISKQKDKETNYRYDANDRLIEVKSDRKTSYIYDAFHRRVAKIEEHKTTRYLYIGQDEIGAVNENGEIEELRILGQGHGAEIGASIAIELKEEVYVPSHDYRGNIVCLADMSGKAVEIYRYTAFGEIQIYNAKNEKIDRSLVDNPWRFASKRYDEESGYVYFGRRYYDPENGRWTSMDPAKLVDGTNLYAYLHHNPLHAFDLYGLQEEEPYYPLANVDHQRNDTTSPEDAAPNQAPVGFMEKKDGKKNRMYFCGINQLAEMGISFVNGIMNKLVDAYHSSKTISELANDHYVTFVYNQSQGFLVDLVRAACELYFYAETPAVLALREKWYAFFASVGEYAMMLHLCHSEGAIITRNALRNFPEELRQRIIVAAFCPGAYIEDKYAAQVTHYRSTRDIVPLLDVLGAYRCRESTVVLDPHPDAAWLDHSFDSPTFREYKQVEIDEYYQQYGSKACVGF